MRAGSSTCLAFPYAGGRKRCEPCWMSPSGGKMRRKKAFGTSPFKNRAGGADPLVADFRAPALEARGPHEQPLTDVAEVLSSIDPECYSGVPSIDQTCVFRLAPASTDAPPPSREQELRARHPRDLFIGVVRSYNGDIGMFGNRNEADPKLSVTGGVRVQVRPSAPKRCRSVAGLKAR